MSNVLQLVPNDENNSFSEQIKGKGYIEQKELAEQQKNKIKENALKEEEINSTLSNSSVEAILNTFSNFSKHLIAQDTKIQTIEVDLAIVKQDYEERKNLCDDEEIQTINTALNSAVQSVLIKYGLEGNKYEKAVHNMMRGKLKSVYHIRFWAKNNTQIKKTKLKDILLSIPQFQKGISLSQIEDRVKGYKETEDERNIKQDKESLNRMIEDGRAQKLEDGSVIIKNK